MSYPGTTASATPADMAPARTPSACPQILGWLAARARELFVHIERALAQNLTPTVPSRIAHAVAKDPKSALVRIDATLSLAIALARTLAGDFFYLRRPTPRAKPAPPAATPTPRTSKPRCATEADRERAQLRRLRHTLETQPISKLARRIANRLGIGQTHDLYPHELIAVTETPAQWSHRLFGAVPPYRPAIIVPKGWKPPRPLKATLPAPDLPPPDYHPRE